ncbi:MAG TPA: restriction endonuclease subunit S, partial [Alistipes sp.]|nr:restriction endonuclease subunit S [Alistipes sp.]
MRANKCLLIADLQTLQSLIKG